MKRSTVRAAGTSFPVCSLNTLVIGSGAAGLNAAVRLFDESQRDVAVLTDGFGDGTSSRSGSDKQTYYKISLAGDEPDSPFAMARDLARGGSMHGDIALVEAQNSAEAFLRLVRIGVPFPHDPYGGYVGYKTDHDPRQRATSAGPLTSRLMFEALAREARRRKIAVFDGHQAISLLTDRRRRKVMGAIALDRSQLRSPRLGFVLFNAKNVVLATGGPGGMYKHSVYPEGQTGSHGLAFEAGAVAHNLTESQYGLASVKFRWNLSGTYQQVIPRYVSTDARGGGEREFLNEHFEDMGRLGTAIFLKGYQWPFDPRKVCPGGSSLIDLLVHEETVVKGRRVYLDFRRNPGDGVPGGFNLRLLAAEAFGYLEKSGALQTTPIARLKHMNRPAVQIYQEHGIDLAKEPLEIAVCAQHNNGGFRGNIWWESNVRGLFPVGEVCGTHGVYRPGGSALNAGQVGSARAALYIAKEAAGRLRGLGEFLRETELQVREKREFALGLLGRERGNARLLREGLEEIRGRMSGCGAQIRRAPDVQRETAAAWTLVERLRRELRIPSAGRLPEAFKVLDLALTHAVYLEAIQEYLRRGGKSRGSFLVPDNAGFEAGTGPLDRWRFSMNSEDDFVSRKILEVRLAGTGRVRKRWVDVRPIPEADSWFETVWRDFLRGKTIRREG